MTAPSPRSSFPQSLEYPPTSGASGRGASEYVGIEGPDPASMTRAGGIKPSGGQAQMGLGKTGSFLLTKDRQSGPVWEPDRFERHN
jgi:hypothetical protein